ncbi:MAG: hypothetical protein ACREQY_01915, partial [Candidatus Binatia bacterium]
MAEPSRWRLYLDEAGRFEDAEDEVVVAGLLIRDLPTASPLVLRQALLDAAPGLPWPLHANLLNLPVFFALAARAAREGGHSAPSLLDPLADEVVRRLSPAFAEEVEQVLSSLRVNRPVAWEHLKPLDEALRHLGPVTYRRLQGVARAAARAVSSVIRALVEASGGDRHSPHVLVVSAGETVRGDASEETDPATDFGTRRYLTQLECLLERVVGLLSLRDGSHEVFVLVLGRDVIDQTLGARTALHLRHLGEVIRRVPSSPAGKVRLIPEGVARFDEAVGALPVLADFVANRARHILDKRELPLFDVEARLVSRLSAPVSSW